MSEVTPAREDSCSRRTARSSQTFNLNKTGTRFLTAAGAVQVFV